MQMKYSTMFVVVPLKEQRSFICFLNSCLSYKTEECIFRSRNATTDLQRQIVWAEIS